MQTIFQRICDAAATDVTVLILGESGTGKELVAQSIHRRSSRANEPFIPVNTGAISKNLVGSELFGHQKGAFTGATDTKPGKFEQANKGTLFLDEISTMDEATQVSLLRVLETRKIQRIGGRRFIPVDVRIISASNKKLFHSDLSQDAIIRQDLFHRLSVFTITLPPLRERGEDILLLSEELLNQANLQFNKYIRSFESEVIDILLTYHWPGNIRELKNVIQRAVLICRNDRISLDNLPARIRRKKLKTAEICLPIGTSLRDMERVLIQKTLESTKGNRKKTAEILGISRRALYNKINKY
ncbi:sigma-54-dependent Fis family transcriptional regulator [bacterium]|nr:sigma-54-dependent Fis family transcriptional regulator [bacterium]